MYNLFYIFKHNEYNFSCDMWSKSSKLSYCEGQVGNNNVGSCQVREHRVATLERGVHALTKGIKI